MAWYEKASTGFRARFAVPGKASDGVGPVLPTLEAAKQWAIDHGHDRADLDTIAELIKRWRDVKTAEKRNRISYLDEVEHELTTLAAERKWVRWRDITMPAIDQWKIDTGGVNVSKRLACLQALLRWGWRQYGLNIDPVVLRHRLAKAPRKVVADVLLTEKQVARIMTAATAKGPQVAALIHYLSTYGARPISACTRLVKDVKFDQAELLVDGKHSGQWSHALLPKTLDYFAACTKDRGLDEPLFLDPRSGRGWEIGPDHAASSLCDWYLRTLGRPLVGRELQGIYHLKRYAITRMLARGMDPATVAKFTGHLDLSQVLVYARANQVTTRSALKLICVPQPHRPHRSAKGIKVIKAVGNKGRRG